MDVHETMAGCGLRGMRAVESRLPVVETECVSQERLDEACSGLLSRKDDVE